MVAEGVEVFFGIVQLLGDGFGVQNLVAQREGARLGEGVQVLQQGKQRKADRKLDPGDQLAVPHRLVQVAVEGVGAELFIDVQLRGAGGEKVLPVGQQLLQPPGEVLQIGGPLRVDGLKAGEEPQQLPQRLGVRLRIAGTGKRGIGGKGNGSSKLLSCHCAKLPSPSSRVSRSNRERERSCNREKS